RAVAVYGSGLNQKIGVFANDETGLLLGVNGASGFQEGLATAIAKSSVNTSISLDAVNAPITSGQKLNLIAFPTTAGSSTITKQQVTATSSSSGTGPQTITVTSFTATAAFPVGSPVLDV